MNLKEFKMQMFLRGFEFKLNSNNTEHYIRKGAVIYRDPSKNVLQLQTKYEPYNKISREFETILKHLDYDDDKTQQQKNTPSVA